MKYRSSNKIVKERVVHPYKIFQYKSSIYLLAYCEYREEIRYFKLSRIEKFSILKEKFKINQELNLEIDSDCLGIFEGKEVNFKIEIKYPIAQTIKERIWGQNQVIVENESNNSIIFEAKMKDTEETKTWILGMGSSAVVLEPAEFVNKIKNELQETTKLYK
ncbi:WYL domain-containing protein [Clostridium botulinum]|nr:WYL domain-containing protein [Clostridium botulinum]